MPTTVSARSAAARAHWLLILQLMAAACSEGRVLILGSAEPSPWHFGEPRLVEEIASPAKTDNPSLTADLLELFFTSERGGTNADLYVAARSTRDARFSAPMRIDALSADGIETCPAVTADGLTLYWASDRPGGAGDLDVWMATRSKRGASWSMPENVRSLSSSAKDLPRLPGQHGEIMPLSSDRLERGYYAILFAQRDGDTPGYRDPQPVPELRFERESTVDGFLSEDGLTLFYVTGPAIGAADMYVASRRSTDAAFEHFTALTELNTPSDERDPWLSADRSRFYFSSDRSGRYAIYEVEVLPNAD